MTSLVRAAMLIVGCVFLVADTQDAGQTAVAQLPDTGHRRVEESTVVRGDEQGA